MHKYLIIIIIFLFSCKPSLERCVKEYGNNKIVKIDTVINYDTTITIIDTVNNTFENTFDSAQVSLLDSGEILRKYDSLGNLIEILKNENGDLSVIATRKPKVIEVPVEVRVPVKVEKEVPCFEKAWENKYNKEKIAKTSWKKRFFILLSAFVVTLGAIFRKELFGIITKFI